MLYIIALSILFGIQTSSKVPTEYYAFIEPVEHCPFLQVEGSEVVIWYLASPQQAASASKPFLYFPTAFVLGGYLINIC